LGNPAAPALVLSMTYGSPEWPAESNRIVHFSGEPFGGRDIQLN
jgi:hypothetical protein